MEVNITNLTKKYGSQKAVDDISFTVKTGEVLGFLGPNGAGKTTTMKILAGYLASTSGDATIGGISVRENPEEIKKHIGYLPESNPLYYDMPVIDYLEFAALLQGVPKSKLNERIRLMIVECGLNEEKHKKIGELSKGYKQRVGLAQAMIHDPELLILDEPTTGLDPNQIVEIRKLIKRIGQQKTVILSTHILPEVEATCDRIMIINRGKIVADGSPQTLRKQAQGSEILKIRIEDAVRDEIITNLRSLPSVEIVDPDEFDKSLFEIQSKTDTSSKREIFKLCVDKGWILTELIPYERKLEDIFRDVTVK